MIAFDTPIPISWIVIGAALAAVVLTWVSFRLKSVIRPRYLWSLAGLRALTCVLLLLLLLNPYWLKEQPDPDGFRVAVLFDASGSMDTRDIENGSRFDLLADWLDDDSASPLRALREKGYRLDVSLFAEDTVPWAGENARLLPGGTAIGSALQETASEATGRRSDLGAVLLVSDGQSNVDSSPIEVARRYRAEGIPVSTIGVGSRTPPGEVTAGFTDPRFQGEKGEPMNLQVAVKNTRNSPQDLRLELHSDEGLIDAKDVTIPANSEEMVVFSVTPFQAGGEGYRLEAKVPGLPPQVDVAAVEVSEPDQFRLLYLGSQPSLDYRFLQQAAEATDQISLESIIQTGPESFFHQLTAEQERNAPADQFPTEPDFFNAFDAILLGDGVLGQMKDAAPALRDFVAHRGGGLLLTGGLTGLPEELAALSPIVSLEETEPFARRELSIAPAPIFTEIVGGALFDQPAIFLPEELPASLATEAKRGARPVLHLADGQSQSPLMSVQAYGAGRVGWLGSDATWRWRMASATGLEQHRLFWNNVMVWLASTGKPRMSVPLQGTRVPLAEEMDAGIEVMGSDFRPAQEAEVEATVVSPSGETRQFSLQPSFRQPGRFESDFRPNEAGEYRIRYNVKFPGGEELTEESFFIASHNDRERQETAYREGVLRDIARLTGGEFRHYDDAASLDDIPLKEGIATREIRRYLAGNPLFLLLLALPLFGEWYIRRKIGLK